MNNESLRENLEGMEIDPEQLKITVGIIKRCITDLQSAKGKADEAWELCRNSLNKEILNDIDEKRAVNNKLFDEGIENIELAANKLESVSNIWQETEKDIITSSKEIDGLLSEVQRRFSNPFKNINSN